MNALIKDSIPRFSIFVSAVAFGFLEAFAFDNGLHLGPPDFFLWVGWYHVPMGIFSLLYCIAVRQPASWFLWILFEDMGFFYISQDYTLGWFSWITAGMGGIYFPLGFLPTTYLILLFLWVAFEYAILKWRTSR